MVSTIQGMLDRAAKIKEKRILNLGGTDLRGWHFVINGGVLLHLSNDLTHPGMFGRYTNGEDSYARCMEAFIKIKEALGNWFWNRIKLSNASTNGNLLTPRSAAGNNGKISPLPSPKNQSFLLLVPEKPVFQEQNIFDSKHLLDNFFVYYLPNIPG